MGSFFVSTFWRHFGARYLVYPYEFAKYNYNTGYGAAWDVFGHEETLVAVSQRTVLLQHGIIIREVRNFGSENDQKVILEPRCGTPA